MRTGDRTTRPLPGTLIDPLYPDSDGKPVGETDFHAFAIHMLLDALWYFFRHEPSVYAATNLNFYFEQGRPRSRRDPDVLVARGVVGNHQRRSFRVWEEGVFPCTIFEMASGKTFRNDLGIKRRLYARLNIPEYFVFDAEGGFVEPRLRGFRTVNRRSQEMQPATDGSLECQQLGLRLTPEGPMLRLHDLRTGLPVLTRTEQTDALTAEVERLRAELARRGRKK